MWHDCRVVWIRILPKLSGLSSAEKSIHIFLPKGRFYTDQKRSCLCDNTFLCTHAKSLQVHPTLCDLMAYSLPGSFVHGILKAGIVEWVAIPISRGSSRIGARTCNSYVSCIAGGFSTTSDTWEAHTFLYILCKIGNIS